jgi:hypothetical protein
MSINKIVGVMRAVQFHIADLKTVSVNSLSNCHDRIASVAFEFIDAFFEGVIAAARRY